jgi:uncharacterized protein
MYFARSGPVSPHSKPLLEYFFCSAVDWAAQHRIPVQLHTGFGDRDIDLRLANPLRLRPLLERGTLDRSPLVLLHASYPYVREAAYLASVYPDVYVDRVSPRRALRRDCRTALFW